MTIMRFVFLIRVRNWALKFGVDLWEFGRQATKLGEIQRVNILLLNILFPINLNTTNFFLNILFHFYFF